MIHSDAVPRLIAEVICPTAWQVVSLCLDGFGDFLHEPFSTFVVGRPSNLMNDII